MERTANKHESEGLPWIGQNLFYINSHLDTAAQLVGPRFEPVTGRTIHGGIVTPCGKNVKCHTILSILKQINFGTSGYQSLNSAFKARTLLPVA